MSWIDMSRSCMELKRAYSNLFISIRQLFGWCSKIFSSNAMRSIVAYELPSTITLVSPSILSLPHITLHCDKPSVIRHRARSGYNTVVALHYSVLSHINSKLLGQFIPRLYTSICLCMKSSRQYSRPVGRAKPRAQLCPSGCDQSLLPPLPSTSPSLLPLFSLHPPSLHLYEVSPPA